MELAPGFCLSDSSKFCFFLSVLHVIRREPHKTPAPAASFLIPRIATVAHQTVSPLSWRAEKLPVATPTPFAEFSVTYFCKSSPFLLPFTSLATGMGHQLSGGGGGGGACWLLHSSSLSGYLGQRYNSAEHSSTSVTQGRRNTFARERLSQPRRLLPFTHLCFQDTASVQSLPLTHCCSANRHHRTFEKLHYQTHRRDLSVL